MIFDDVEIEREFIDWKGYYGKKFKLVYTPKGKQTGKWTKGQISIVTPTNARAWREWPEVSREDYLKFKNNWRNIQKNLSDDKYLQITETNDMQFNKLVSILIEQNIIDVVDDNWSVKDPANSRQMTASIFQGAHIDWQMRQDGYSDEDIKRYFDLRRKNMTHADALKQVAPPKPKEINYQDPEVQRKIKQAFIKMGYNTQEDMHAISDLLRPEKINSLKASMLANRMDVNKILQENFGGSNMTNDKGVKRSVQAVVKFAQDNKHKYFKKDFPISKLEHELKWWDEQNKTNPEASNDRMMKADTSYPLLVIKNDAYGLSVSDGLNRLKKARDVEGKDKVDVYIVPEVDIPDSTIV